MLTSSIFILSTSAIVGVNVSFGTDGDGWFSPPMVAWSSVAGLGEVCRAALSRSLLVWLLNARRSSQARCQPSRIPPFLFPFSQPNTDSMSTALLITLIASLGLPGLTFVGMCTRVLFFSLQRQAPPAYCPPSPPLSWCQPPSGPSRRRRVPGRQEMPRTPLRLSAHQLSSQGMRMERSFKRRLVTAQADSASFRPGLPCVVTTLSRDGVEPIVPRRGGSVRAMAEPRGKDPRGQGTYCWPAAFPAWTETGSRSTADCQQCCGKEREREKKQMDRGWAT